MSTMHASMGLTLGEEPAPKDHALVPTWLREVETGVITNPQILLYGNVRDKYLVPTPAGAFRFCPVREALWWCLERMGYQALIAADVVDGIQIIGHAPDAEDVVRELVGKQRLGALLTLPALGEVLRAVTTPPGGQRVGLVLEYAARLIRGLPQLDGPEHELFATCEKLANNTVPLPWSDGTPRYNPVVWVVQHERELPTWFISSGEGIRRIAVPVPELDDRQRAARALAAGLVTAEAEPGSSDSVAERFAAQTVGMSLRSLVEIVRLSRAGVGPVHSVEDAVRCYRVGILENPWGKAALRRRLVEARERIGGRVRGQDEAVQRSLDIVVRSVMGLSGAQASVVSSKPRGVMFFAGPTGVGKTELAKALTELIFGDERAYIRFDMSEFSAEHASERLAGAPPGYLGHDAGGELTNAVRERPFSLILFDEIEKAHPRVLDKFLQILDDGRLTDGSGSTVYFSEAVIVFTSNLGVRDVDQDLDERGLPVEAPPLAKMSRTDLENHITSAVRDHFIDNLSRPELLNRLGDNIVVFNFISESAADDIFTHQLGRVLDRVERQLGIALTVAPPVLEKIQNLATADLSFGGRGIGSVLERVFVNPLARALFVASSPPGTSLTVSDLRSSEGVWELELSQTT